jgi:hypothetical protein
MIYFENNQNSLEFLFDACSPENDCYLRVIAFDGVLLYAQKQKKNIDTAFIYRFLFKYWHEKLDLLNSKISAILTIYLDAICSNEKIALRDQLLMQGFASSRKSLVWLDLLIKLDDSLFTLEHFTREFFDELHSTLEDPMLCHQSQQLMKTSIKAVLSRIVDIEEQLKDRASFLHSVIVDRIVALYSLPLLRVGKVFFKETMNVLPPSVFRHVVHELKRTNKAHYAVLFMLKHDISNKNTSSVDILKANVRFIKTCLVHEDPTIRLDTLAMITEKKKSTELVADIELELVEYFLQYNIKNMPSDIRHSVCSGMKRFLERLGKCLIKCSKEVKGLLAKEEKRLENEMKGLSITLKEPSSTTRKKQEEFKSVDALTLITLYKEFISRVFELFLRNILIGCPYYKVTSSLQIIAIILNNIPLEFVDFTTQTYQKVYRCLFSTFPDIRQMAFDVMMRMDGYSKGGFFKENTDLFDFKVIMKHLNSPHIHESESGVLLLDYFIKNSGVNVLEYIVKFESEMMSDMENNVVDTLCEKSPFQGRLIALKCLIMSMKNEFFSTDEYVQRTGTVLVAVCEYVGDILKNASPEGYFTENEIDEPETEDGFSEAFNAVFKRYQFLSSFCWRSMKESVELLTYIIIERLKRNSQDLFSRTNTLYILELLLTVRHCGAFNHIQPNFQSICEFHTYEACNEMIKYIINDIKVGTSSSALGVTRRSGGIPLALVSLILNESNQHYKRLLNDCMESLIEMLYVDEDVKDLNAAIPPKEIRCKIHSLNCIKTIVGECQLKADINQGYISKIFQVCMIGFSSKSWMIRNSSTMLYTNLVHRVFGANRSNGKSLTANDFFKKYESLEPFIKKELKSAISVGCFKTFNSPTLYPILLLLSRLTLCKNTLPEFVELLLPFKGHFHYRVRYMASCSIVAFIKNAEEMVERLMNDLKIDMKENELHGTLMMMTGICKAFSLTARVQLDNLMWIFKRSDLNVALFHRFLEGYTDFRVELIGFEYNHNRIGNIELARQVNDEDCYESVVCRIERYVIF